MEAASVEKTFSSIAPELRKAKITIKREKHINPFENTVIPDGYFKYRRYGKSQAQIFVSQKIFYLRQEQCLELKKGQVWFEGEVHQIRKNKNGKRFYHILITRFKGKKVPVKFWGSIWVNFFKRYGLDENFLNKKLAIILSSNYIGKSELSFRIKTSPLKNQGLFDSEDFGDDDELTENEIENLKALDWSKIECLKK